MGRGQEELSQALIDIAYERRHQRRPRGLQHAARAALDGFGVVESFVPQRFLPQLLWVRKFGPILFLVLIFTGLFRVVPSPAVNAILKILGVPA
jgi:hypothetical protein